ncbi:hypothetical protein ACFX15_046241 [Malus domestica]
MFISSRSITNTIQSLQILFLGWRLRNKKTFKSFLVVAAALSNKARQELESKGYLTDLKNMNTTSDAEISDNENARLLAQTNPTHQRGWIAAARLEVVAGNIQVARLASPDETKALISKGVKSIPNSDKLWREAAELEHDDLSRSRVLRKGLEHIPDSVRLWEAVVELAGEEDKRLLLHRAMKCCPLHVELWLQHGALETNENMWMSLPRQERRYCVVYI